jgi:hypothetical protein
MIIEMIEHSTPAPAGKQKQCKNKQQGTTVPARDLEKIAFAKRSCTNQEASAGADLVRDD